MGGFLAPAFLFGLLALAVPVLIHLRHRERRETLAFPSLMFMRRVPYRSVRRQKLHHLALFVLRCLAFALLAMAFARPFFAGTAARVPPLTGARERVILVDRSFSMGYGDRWKRALTAARRAVDDLSPEDRASLILFSDRAEGIVASTKDHASLRAAVDAARLGAGGTRYGPALKLAQEWLQGSDQPRREAVLITDFQKVGWEAQEDVRLPEGTRLTYVDLSDRDASNLAVTDVALQRERESGRERVAATAHVINKGRRPARAVRAVLELGGRVAEEKRVDLEPMSAASVAFEAVAFPAATTRGVVRIEGDSLAADNAFHFVLAPGQDLAVLLAEGGVGSGVYLRRALQIGDRPRFRVETKPLAALSPADLAGRSAVIVNGPASEVAARALAAYVDAGGGLLVFVGEASAAWSGSAAKLLPGALGATVDRLADSGGTLGYLDYDHPVFALFKAPRSGDFSNARFLRYRTFLAGDAAKALACYDDGRVALAEAALGKGRVLVWTSSLDGIASDLPLQPVFLPFVHQLLKHVAGHAETRAWRSVGEAAEVAPATEGETTVIAPSGAKKRLAGNERFVELSEAGFYEVQTRHGGEEKNALLAVNVSPAESDLSALDPEELVLAVRSGKAASAKTAPATTAEDRERLQSLSWYLLATAFLSMLGETVLSNRLSEAAR